MKRLSSLLGVFLGCSLGSSYVLVADRQGLLRRVRTNPTGHIVSEVVLESVPRTDSLFDEDSEETAARSRREQLTGALREAAVFAGLAGVAATQGPGPAWAGLFGRAKKEAPYRANWKLIEKGMSADLKGYWETILKTEEKTAAMAQKVKDDATADIEDDLKELSLPDIMIAFNRYQREVLDRESARPANEFQEAVKADLQRLDQISGYTPGKGKFRSAKRQKDIVDSLDRIAKNSKRWTNYMPAPGTKRPDGADPDDDFVYDPEADFD
uniref:Uncharacterized protein n=1 Tax=Chromera velia CCMP2878 TaxID=1169474 RepID=A0A0G4FVM8_9ALVE|mmetsp:Transcript_29144/g.57135  ORF Transcript_29144/g.57135 Transcript_29144/m.57135 type:complete len:269 (+) Transcript_29144:177-983(+)|eukprot:Cvel_18991.t1-p1 / transcript=Cvel_18991.t1 / gene=Cvel_18991 / organism=Chromera_velia_CCMP2878 / gene_product=hypothetical protein / transcript_product=hypothetical protein / location=Cvel_scaffold1607:10154-13357(-) / protein_length=268 / sequence_SO=supercontig / SO=protein_coding / is_pseudo=false